MKELERALIIFARKPEIGKVKTRLAATIGDEKTLGIYTKLLLHTKTIATDVSCDKYVFLTEMKHDNFWDGFSDEVQEGDSLGMRMHHAFQLLFNKGYKQVLIIGSDCPGLNSYIINQGFEKLMSADVVIGPATDGGYYLLGMKKLHNQLFENKQWSTGSVLNDTLDDINAASLNCAIMQKLTDVDEEKDIPADWL